MPNRRFNKQVANQMKSGGRVKKMGGGMSTRRRDMKSGYYPDDMGMKGGPMMKKGGRVKKKKQGYKDRKDESIAMRIRKKRTKKQLKASRDDSYGRFGSKAKKSGKINKQFMAKDFIQKAIKKPGALRKSLGIKKGKKIPASKLSCLLYTSPSPRDRTRSRMPSSA